MYSTKRGFWAISTNRGFCAIFMFCNVISMSSIDSRNKLNGISTVCLLHCKAEIYICMKADAQQGCTGTGVIKMIIVSEDLLAVSSSYHDFRSFINLIPVTHDVTHWKQIISFPEKDFSVQFNSKTKTLATDATDTIFNYLSLLIVLQ